MSSPTVPSRHVPPGPSQQPSERVVPPIFQRRAGPPERVRISLSDIMLFEQVSLRKARYVMVFVKKMFQVARDERITLKQYADYHNLTPEAIRQYLPIKPLQIKEVEIAWLKEKRSLGSPRQP